MLRHLSLLFVALICFLTPALVFGDGHNPKRIMAAEVMEKMNAGEPVFFIDTRTSGAWAASSVKIANAQRAANNEVLNKIVQKVPEGGLIVTYCT